MILVLNTGSSSVKYRLFTAGLDTLAKGLVERIGEDGGDAPDHESALRSIMAELDLDGLASVGHRVVHGGSFFSAPTVIDDTVVSRIESVSLAPLHNPPALAGIRVARKLLPSVPQVAVFDTAFHATIPPEGRTWAIGTDLAERWGIRRYGFHGTSHAYVSRRTAALLGKRPDEVNVITLHLGNGASACAVEAGRSVATSMGMTPQGGLVMGTRSGDIDPSVIFLLLREAGLPVDDLENELLRRGGLLGLTGDNDLRAILRRRAGGDETATLAFDVYCRRIREYVGAYAAVLGRLDAVTFTGGVGENSPAVRWASVAGLTSLGVDLDGKRNEAGEEIISADGSRVTVCVVPTDEEREIATQTRAVTGDR
jgi:acetate kinase